MKRSLIIIGFLVLVALLPLLTVQAGGLKSKIAKEVVILPVGETVDQDFFAAGERVEISGTVNGDLYAAGGQVLIDGTVNGDVLAAGGQVIISGAVAQDARVAGGILTVSGLVGRNLTAAMAADVVTLESARVAGNIVNFRLPFERFGQQLNKLWLMMKLAGAVSFLILGLAIAGLYPRYAERLGRSLRERPWASLGLGIVVLIAVLIMVAILFVTLVGVPLSIILVGAYLLMIYLAKLPAVILIGRLVTRLLGKDKKIHIAWALTMGTVIYYLMTLIPIIGQILSILAIVFGVGAMALTKGELIKKLRDKELV